MRGARLRTLALALAGVSATGLATPFATTAHAQDANRRTFNIPAQDMAGALETFGRQSGRDILFDRSQVASRRSNAVRGSLDPADALRRLVRGSGLSVNAPNAGTFIVGRGTGEAQAGGAAADNESAREQAITVTGTRIRGGDVPAPIVRIDRRDIRNSEFRSTEQVLAAVPQNFNGVNPNFSGQATGASTIAQQNVEHAAVVDLRGLGGESTLTLVNGHRRAQSVQGQVTDVSAIPLAAVDRIEIVTGGSSAIYGADAVAGVVNIITRRDFDGAETQVSYGGTADGADRFGASQLVGVTRDNLSLIGVYEFAWDQRLDLVRRGLAETRDPLTQELYLRQDIQPESRRHSGYLSARYDVASNVALHGDLLYTHRNENSGYRSLQPGVTTVSTSDSQVVQDQLSANLGAEISLSDWSVDVEVNGGYAFMHSTGQSALVFSGSTFSQSSDIVDRSRNRSLSVVANGPLPVMGIVAPRLAFGAEFQNTYFKRADVRNNSIVSNSRRSVVSAFAELTVPIDTRDTSFSIGQIELLAAARWDEYSDFGSTFNPQFGLIWRPTSRLTLRGSYSSSFRAPSLVQLSSFSMIRLRNISDPLTGGLTPVLFWNGGRTTLQPETADNWNASLDYRLPFLRNTVVTFSFFDIRYRNRIGVPALNFFLDQPFVLQLASRYDGLIDRSPTAAELAAILATDTDGINNNTGVPFNPATQNILTVFPNLVVFDNRTNNISIERVRGLDWQIRSEIPVSFGSVNLGLNATYTLTHRRAITATSPEFSFLNEVGKPVSFRARGTAGITMEHFRAFVNLDYTGSYRNPFTTPASRVDSSLLTNLTVAYDGGETARGILRGTSISLSVANLFDVDPPLIRGNAFAMRYDAANASALGRYISISATKRF